MTCHPNNCPALGILTEIRDLLQSQVDEGRPVATYKDAAKALGISPRTLQRRIDDLGLEAPADRNGRPWWPSSNAVRAWWEVGTGRDESPDQSELFAPDVDADVTDHDTTESLFGRVFYVTISVGSREFSGVEVSAEQRDGAWIVDFLSDEGWAGDELARMFDAQDGLRDRVCSAIGEAVTTYTDDES